MKNKELEMKKAPVVLDEEELEGVSGGALTVYRDPEEVEFERKLQEQRETVARTVANGGTIWIHCLSCSYTIRTSTGYPRDRCYMCNTPW